LGVPYLFLAADRENDLENFLSRIGFFI